MRPSNRVRRQALTLVELLVAVSIIAILIALLVPAIQRVREASTRMACANNIKQLALAVHAYHDREKKMPFNQFDGLFGVGQESRAWSWLTRILPDIGQENLYKLGEIDKTALEWSAITPESVEMFLCPSDPSSQSGPRADAGNLVGLLVGQTNYKGVSGANWGDDLDGDADANFATDWRNPGANGCFDGHSRGDGVFYRLDYLRHLRLEHITDGASNTFMIGEDVPAKTQWCSWPYANNANGTCAIPPNVTKPDGSDYPMPNWENNESFRSRHPGGLQFGVVDGSVRFVANSIELRTYRALATIAGNEPVRLPD